MSRLFRADSLTKIVGAVSATLLCYGRLAGAAHPQTRWSAQDTSCSFGVSLNQPEVDDVARTAPMLAELAAAGVRWARIAIPWDRVEESRGKLDWESVDAVVGEVATNDMELVAYVARTPSWAVGVDRVAPRPWALPPDSAAWDHFLHVAVGRYRGRVRYWEIWNEPSFGFISRASRGRCPDGSWCGTPEEYGALLRQSYAIVKEVDPEARVLLGGLVLSPRSEREDFLGRMLAAFPNDSLFDIANLHHYGAPSALGEKVGYVQRTLAAAHRAAPIWLTETGAGNRTGPREVPGYDGDSGQRRYLQDIVAASRQAGVERLAWFKLFDNQNAAPRFASNGLFTAGGQPKPAVDALRATLLLCAKPVEPA